MRQEKELGVPGLAPRAAPAPRTGQAIALESLKCQVLLGTAPVGEKHQTLGLCPTGCAVAAVELGKYDLFTIEGKNLRV